MIKTLSVAPGVRLRCYRDSRFKHGVLSLQFARPMCREEAAMNALLPAVLLRGCKSCPDLRAITLRLDDLYGASVSAMVRRIGDYQTTGLFCAMTDDRFTLDGDAVLAPALAFLRQLLLEPVTEHSSFKEEFVESEKKNLISAIEAQRNDKRIYAANRLLKLMCSADSFGIPRLGETEQVRAITPESLWAHYQKVITESPVELFYVGSADAQTVAAAVSGIFRDIPADRRPLPPQTGFFDGGGDFVTEEMEITQGKLCTGFVTPITYHHKDFAAMQVANALFGGGQTSKLFMNLREKSSLCYAIGSGYYGSKGILTVSAGIDSSRQRQVWEEMMEQLEDCKAGRFTQEELYAAKEALLSGLRVVHDSPGAIEGYYATQTLSGFTLTPEEYAAAVRAVTAEQAAAAAATLQLHSSFFLKGVGQ